MKAREYPAVDLALLLAAGSAFLLNSQTGPHLPFFPLLSALLLRLAAPYFFVAAGFFWGEALYAAPDAAAQRALTGRVCRRLGGKLLLYLPIVFAMRCCTALLDGWAPGPFARRTLLELLFFPRGPYWTLHALLLALPLLLPPVRRGKEACVLPCALLLYAFASLTLRYRDAVLTGPLGGALRGYWEVFLSFKNALFFALYFVTAGLLTAKHRACIAEHARLRRLVLLAGWALLLIETLTAGPGAAGDRDAMALAFALLAPALFACTAFGPGLPLRRPELLRRLAASAFLLHLPLVWGWTGVLRRLSILPEPRANAFVGAALSAVSFGLIVTVLYRKRWKPFYDWII